MTTISVCNWEDFQHYRDRDPPWIKLYRDILTTEAWLLGTDTSRLVHLASILLAARYRNEIPYNLGLIKKAAHLDAAEKLIEQAIKHLVGYNFLKINAATQEAMSLEHSASTPLATCSSREGNRRESRAEEKDMSGTKPPDAVLLIFNHWKAIWKHPKAQLDDKRIKTIRRALTKYAPDVLCDAISGYLKSAYHTGQNDTHTVYDELELFLRDSAHVDAGLKFGDATRKRFKTTEELIAEGHQDELTG